MIIEVGPDTRPAPRAVVQMERAVQLVGEEEIVAGQQKGAVTATVTRNKIEVVGSRAKIARIIRKIKYRDWTDVEDGISRLDAFAGDDLDVFGADTHRRIGKVVGGDEGIGGGIDLLEFAVQTFPFDKHRVLAGPKLPRLHCMRFEIVEDMVTGPTLFRIEDAHGTISNGFARDHIDVGTLGGKNRARVFDHHAVSRLSGVG